MEIPNYVYIYFLITLCIVIALMGIVFLFNPQADRLIKIGVFWYAFLMEVNLINMIVIMKKYEKSKYKKGIRGPVGEIGMKGHKGDSIICKTSCGDDGMKKQQIYANNYYLNREGGKIINKSQDVQMGQCKFPFIYDHQKFDECITPKDNYKIDVKRIKNTPKEGWCPTTLNNTITKGSNVRTWGYCRSKNESMLREREIEYNNRRTEDQNQYVRDNSGILDLQVVMGNRSSISCPTGFKHVLDKSGKPADMNYNSGGKYIYVCKKDGLASEGIISLASTDSPDKCINMGSGFEPVKHFDVDSNKLLDPADLNKDLKNAQPLYLCKRKGNKKFLTNIDINYQPKNTNNLCSTNMNPDFYTPIYMCPYRNESSSNVIDTAFIYGKDKQLYFFFNNYFFLYDYTKKEIQRDKKNKMISLYYNYKKWGEMKSNNDDKDSKIDAVFTWSKNNRTYFFKGSRVFLYDDKKMSIEPGYPKEISQVFPGIPSNIDAVFTWNYDNKTYFFKNEYFYRFDDQNNILEAGYPKKIEDRWKGIDNTTVPTNITAIFTDNREGKTYIIKGSDLYELTDNNIKKTLQIDTKYKGITNIVSCLLKTENECKDPNSGCKYFPGNKICRARF